MWTRPLLTLYMHTLLLLSYCVLRRCVSNMNTHTVHVREALGQGGGGSSRERSTRRCRVCGVPSTQQRSCEQIPWGLDAPGLPGIMWSEASLQSGAAFPFLSAGAAALQWQAAVLPRIVKQRLFLAQMRILFQRLGPSREDDRGTLVDVRFVRSYVLSVGCIEMRQLVCSLNAGHIWAYLVIQLMQYLMVF